MNHAAGTDIGIQTHLVNRFAIRVIMRWRVAMGTSMRGHGDLADLDRTAVSNLPSCLRGIGAIAWPAGDMRTPFKATISPRSNSISRYSAASGACSGLHVQRHMDSSASALGFSR